MKKLILNSLFIAAISYSLPGLSEAPIWSSEGFEEPESILAHPTQEVLYVGNMKGHPVEVDGEGYISLVSPTGKILNKHWVTGLDAPKGMALHDNLLYVADLKKLRIIDTDKGVLLQSIEVHDSVMLNDIAVGASGAVYISDFLGGGIYRLANNRLEKWISSEQFPHPNGLYFDKDHLLVATWGENIQEDFSTTVLGSLYWVEEDDASISLVKNAEKFGNLDGIARIGNRLFINDWINGNVFEYTNGELTLAFNAGKNAADISARGDELLVPMMFSARIDGYKP